MSEFRALLQAGDFKALRRAWAELCPNLPAPKSDREAEIVMHISRTEAKMITFAARAYSHAWLIERNLPSSLPDDLKPKAQQIHPITVTSVGIAVLTRSPWLKPAMAEVRASMSDAVEDAYAEGNQEPKFVTTRMFEARERTLKQLFGRPNLLGIA